MLKKMMFELPGDPVRRTWSRRAASGNKSTASSWAEYNDDEEEEDDEVGRRPGWKRRHSNAAFGQDALASSNSNSQSGEIDEKKLGMLGKINSVHRNNSNNTGGVNSGSFSTTTTSQPPASSNEMAILSHKVTELTNTVESLQKGHHSKPRSPVETTGSTREANGNNACFAFNNAALTEKKSTYLSLFAFSASPSLCILLFC
jgi:hypothetical protein